MSDEDKMRPPKHARLLFRLLMEMWTRWTIILSLITCAVLIFYQVTHWWLLQWYPFSPQLKPTVPIPADIAGIRFN